MTKEELNFEEAIQKLESIVDKMESGDLKLEEALQSFEEGIKLIRLCNERLQKAEKRIEILLEKEGELEAEPFAAPSEKDGD